MLDRPTLLQNYIATPSPVKITVTSSLEQTDNLKKHVTWQLVAAEFHQPYVPALICSA